MDARLKETVRRRAGFRCEYCHLPEGIAELPFQFDHVIAKQHGGLVTEDNLALACARCNRYLSSDPALNGPFVAWGKEIRKGVVLEMVDNLELAPTIASLLGIKMEGTTGRKLDAILAPGK